MAISTGEESDTTDVEAASAVEIVPLIPGLPDEIAEYCLLRLPFPYQTLARSVSSSWNHAISKPNFQLAKKTLSLSLPYLFVFAFHRSNFRLQWQAFDPRSHRWFVLPPMPLATGPLCPPAFACATIPRRGELFVLGGMRSDTQTPLQTLLSYRASTNSWSVAAPMPTPRAFFVAASIGDKVLAAGGNDSGGGVGGGDDDDDDDAIFTVECYDPAADRWAPAARMQWGLSRYDSAVMRGKLYVTEGWTWPFSFSPRGGVYDADEDTWEEMGVGMREGWTGVAVVLRDKLFVVSEYGDCRVKVYDEGRDTWHYLGGGGVPGVLRKPFSVTGIERQIYVVSCGLNIGVGTVSGGEDVEGEGGGNWWVEWEVVKRPQAFVDLVPSNSQVLYA